MNVEQIDFHRLGKETEIRESETCLTFLRSSCTSGLTTRGFKTNQHSPRPLHPIVALRRPVQRLPTRQEEFESNVGFFGDLHLKGRKMRHKMILREDSSFFQKVHKETKKVGASGFDIDTKY